MQRTLFLVISLLLSFSIAGITVTQAETAGRGYIAAATAAPSSIAADDVNKNDDPQARSSARRRPSGNLRQRPMTPAPAPAPTPPPRFGGGFGRFFGGLAAGALLGSVFSSMLHPFGGFGQGFSLIGLLLDAVLLYLAFKLFRRMANRNYGR
jgi:hypothetical protein